MEFIEAPAFTRHLRDYLIDDGYSALQAKLAANPEFGDLIPGTGGFRKMRWADSRRGKGRRGGLRIIYIPLQIRSSDLVDDSLRQRRSFGLDGEREEGAASRD
jgi:hypothetical protein